ncbi:bacterioferritin [Aquihabitans daechungensis]|uniref:bacterioferritin n=1 Tax=Aquihabitans daechungensis TaxID=1052257 RepID=UPI003BA1862A
MQGDPEIIEALNEILTAELTAINQYFIHAKMRENWGFKKLAAVARRESIEEMEDADKIIERILYFDGVPNLQRYNPVLVGETVPEQLALELETEKAAIERYNRGIALAVAKGDNGTRELMEHRLVDEESHADWLEAQLHVIDTIGVENYLAQQLDTDD